MNILARMRTINIDIAMIAAAVVEVPRWYVAFAAIKEPWWAAVPMGLLLAWGASAGWKAYFADRSRHLLLAINVISLAGALIVIAPVLYAMTFTPLDEINLATVMAPALLMFWAGTLAVTTFIPLVQIAAVKMYAAHPPTEATLHVHDATPTAAASTAAGDAAASPAHSAKPARKPAQKRHSRKHAKITQEQRRAQIAEADMQDAAAIAAQFQISLRTAHADLAAVRNGMLHANGVAQ
mgnify:CR=1 FL=1